MNLQETLRALADGKCVQFDEEYHLLKELDRPVIRKFVDGKIMFWYEGREWKESERNLRYWGLPATIVPDPSKAEEPKYLLGDKELDRLLRDGYIIKSTLYGENNYFRYCFDKLHELVAGRDNWEPFLALEQHSPWAGAKQVSKTKFASRPAKITDWQPIPSDDDEYMDVAVINDFMNRNGKDCRCNYCLSFRKKQIGKKVRTYDDVKVLLDNGFCIDRGAKKVANLYRKKDGELQHWYPSNKTWRNFDYDYLSEGPWTIAEEPKEEVLAFKTSGQEVYKESLFATAYDGTFKTPDEKYAEGDKAIIEKYGFPDRPEWGKMSVELAALNRKICKEEVMEELKKKGVIN